MAAFVVLMALMLGSGALGYVVGRHGLEDVDRGWMSPERRRWRP